MIIQDDIEPLVKVIEADVNTLLDRFSKEVVGKSGFEVFKKIWLDMNLHLIYGGRVIFELFIFQDLLLDIIKKRLFEPFPQLWNVGAVYLLFACIQLVPYKSYLSQVKVRFTLDDLKNLKNLMGHVIPLHEEDDAIIILLDILKNHSSITAHPMTDLKVTFIKKQVNLKSENKNKQIPEGMSTLVTSANTFQTFLTENLTMSGMLHKLQQSCEEYAQMKTLIPAQHKSSMFDLVGPNLINNLCETMPAIEQTAQETIGDTRQELKYKSFKDDRRKIRGRRTTDETDEVEEFVEFKKPKQSKRSESCFLHPFKNNKKSVIPSFICEDKSNKKKHYKSNSESKINIKKLAEIIEEKDNIRPINEIVNENSNSEKFVIQTESKQQTKSTNKKTTTN